MRFLKNKITRALEAQKINTDYIKIEEDTTAVSTALNPSQISQVSSPYISQSIEDSQPKKRCRKNESSKPIRIPSSTKNATNFGKAIASFAVSHLAPTYLEPLLKEKGLSYVDFFNFVDQRKDKIRSIDTFKSMILVEEEDDTQQAALKETFKTLGEIFIKCFSVNWIIHGKVTHKMVYLKYRYKMLRRIQNPENFTYVKKRTAKKSKSDN